MRWPRLKCEYEFSITKPSCGACFSADNYPNFKPKEKPMKRECKNCIYEENHKDRHAVSLENGAECFVCLTHAAAGWGHTEYKPKTNGILFTEVEG